MNFLNMTSLTHCGLVTPHGNIDLGQYCLRQWFVAWKNQAITSVDLISKVFCGIRLRSISHKVLMNLIHNMCSEIILWTRMPVTEMPMFLTLAREWVNKLIAVLRPFLDSRHPYKPCNHNLNIGIIIFPHTDNTQSAGTCQLEKK